METNILIEPTGRVRFVWDDALAPLIDAGRVVEVSRVSHVEPTPSGQWTADLSPCDGPTLGPFPLRAQALEAEREWVESHLLEGKPT